MAAPAAITPAALGRFPTTAPCCQQSPLLAECVVCERRVGRFASSSSARCFPLDFDARLGKPDGVDFAAPAILRILDDASRAFTFPCLDNGYVYLAASRLSLFRSPQDWALVIEIFGYSPRAGIPDTSIFTFASRLHDRDPSSNFVSRDAYEQYLRNNPHNEFRSIYPIEEGPWMDEEAPEMVAVAGELQLRGRVIPLPPASAYARHGIELQEERPAIFELCRYLAAEHRELVLATPEEQRISIFPEMTRILQLDEWHHPDIVQDQMPSATETFQQLADVLASGDPSRYRPTEEPNTHWEHWPEGGTL